MLVHMDPIPGGGTSVHFTSTAAAILAGREMASGSTKVRTDQELISDFAVVHWASKIESVIEQMAKAMFMATYCVQEDRWPDAAQDSWRLKAKAALKALGVPLP